MVEELRLTLNPGPLGGHFSPGSTLTGSFVIEVKTAQKFKTITVYVRGEGHVRWLESQTAGDSSRTVVFESHEKYVHVQQVLWTFTDSPDGVLPAGRHTYPFQVALPGTCPTSFDSPRGNISYQVEGCIATDMPNLKYEISQAFKIFESVTYSPGVGEQPVHFECHKKVKTGLFRSGDVLFKVDLPKTRYCIGEEIPVSWYVENGSNKRATPAFSIVEIVTFFTNGKTSQLQNLITFHNCTAIPSHSARGGDNVRVTIPACHPTMTRSNIIKSSYNFVMTLMIPGVFSISTSQPLCINTI